MARIPRQSRATCKPLLTRHVISSLFDSNSGSLSGNRGNPNPSVWDSNVFVGREMHLMQLETIFQRIRDTQTSETVIIQGISGAGKTTLVNEFVKTLPPNALYVRGKFDQLSCRSPFCVLIAMAEQLCRQILRSDYSEEIRTRIRNVLGSELSLLGNLVPELTNIHLQLSEPSKRANSDTSSHRFKQVYRSLVRSAASFETPLVLFLDDIQSADIASMEVLDALVNDTLSRCIFIIGTFRGGEPSSDSNPFLGYQNLPHSILPGSDDTSDTSHVTCITVEKLNSFELNNMISTILHMEQSATQSLSALVMNKTEGNPFYVISFLDMLHSTGLLSLGLDGGWTWDENRIQSQTNVADNLIQVLETKLLRIPSHARSILQIASFIGHEFTTDVLSLILYEEQDMIEGEYSFDRHSMEEIRKRISLALELATDQGLLESTNDSTTFKFAHDKIRQTLYEDLMPDLCERQLLHQRIGQLILESLKDHQNLQIGEERSIFLAVNNLNRALGSVENPDSRVAIAQLNLRAGKYAVEKSDFILAAEYLRTALHLLPSETCWTSHYALCIDLFCAAAYVERILGCYHRSDELVKDILKNAESLEHQCAAYEMQVNCLAAKGDVKAAVFLGLDVLRKLRVSLPEKFSIALVAKEFLLAKLALGRKPLERLVDKPVLTDQRMTYVLSFIMSVRFNAFLLGDAYKEIFAFMVLRAFRITIKYGLSPLYAPLSLIAWGILHTAMGDLSTAIKCSHVAFSIIDKLEAEPIRGRASLISYGTLYFWRNELDEGISEKILIAYHHAMSYGDTFYAKFSVVAWIVVKTYWDNPISKIHDHVRVIVSEMREDNAKQALLLTLPSWQFVLNLCGDEENMDPSFLIGEAVGDSFGQEALEIDSKFALLRFRQNEMMIAYTYENWVCASAALSDYKLYEKHVSGIFPADFSFVWVAICSYDLFYVTRKVRHKKDAQRAHKKVKKLADSGTQIFWAPSLLLQAMKSLCVNNNAPKLIEKEFEAAISSCEKARCVIFQALGQERLGKYFLNSSLCQSKGKKYLEKAIEIYKNWGALQKAQWLQRMYPCNIN